MIEAPYAPWRRKPGAAEPLPDFPGTPLELVRAGARDLQRAAAKTREFALGGRTIDVAGLDEHVGRVCAKALDLPPEEGRLASGALQALLAELDQLFEAMRLSAGPP